MRHEKRKTQKEIWKKDEEEKGYYLEKARKKEVKQN